MIELEASGYFITGSDTDVGKTYIACEVIRQLQDLGVDVEPRKPAESGCDVDADGRLVTHDAEALRQANRNQAAIDLIAPYRFRAALAPHRAARLEGRQLAIENLLDACKPERANSCLVVEGAGGFYSPLAENGLNADLASLLQLAVIIVVNDRIGAVNQALMTAAAVADRRLRVAAIVLNQVEAEKDPAMDNVSDLAAHCDSPIFSCGHGGDMPPLFRVPDAGQ